MKKLITLTLLIACCGCEEEQVTVTGFGMGSKIRTVHHDSHSFVVLIDSGTANSLIHHPSCPCLKEVHHE